VESAASGLVATLAKIRVPIGAGLGAVGVLGLLAHASKTKVAAGMLTALLVAGVTILPGSFDEEREPISGDRHRANSRGKNVVRGLSLARMKPRR